MMSAKCVGLEDAKKDWIFRSEFGIESRDRMEP